VIDASTGGRPSSADVDFVRSPDTHGPDGRGRYLIAINSGFGCSSGQDKPRPAVAVGHRFERGPAPS